MLRRTVSHLRGFVLLPTPPLHAYVSSVAELMFLETSALTGENVEEGFLKCARTILNKIDSGEHGLFSASSPSVRASQLPAWDVLIWVVLDR